MKISLMDFPKEISFGQMGHFGPENGLSSKLWIRSKLFFFKSSRIKGAKRYMKLKSMIFWKSKTSLG